MEISQASDLTRPEVIADPYPAYDALRAASPLWGLRDFPPGTVPGQDEPVTAWVLLRYADVDRAARDNVLFSSRDPRQDASDAPTLMLVNHDEPEHAPLRRLVSAAFTRRRIEALRPWVNEALTQLWDELGEGEVEFVSAVAARVPALVMARLLGFPGSDARLLESWAPAFMLSADLTPEERNASNAQMVQYVMEHVARVIEGKGESWDHLTRALLDAEVDGERLTPEEVARFCITLLVAGAETTTGLIANVVFELAQRSPLRDRVAADQNLIGPFIEETLRLTGPPQRLFRIATRDVEIRHAKVREGDWVALFYGAANRDPEVFPDPDAFDIDRSNVNQHLSFGRGVHFCLGAHLARLEVSAVVASLLERFPEIALGAAAPRKQQANLLTHAFASLPIRLASAGKGKHRG